MFFLALLLVTLRKSSSFVLAFLSTKSKRVPILLVLLVQTQTALTVVPEMMQMLIHARSAKLAGV